MKTIVITGPSGSGKTFLANKLAKKFNNSIILKTDSYYRDNLYIKILSVFMNEIYDRIISIKSNQILQSIASISNQEKYITLYNYDFISRKGSKLIRKNYFQYNNKFIIIEGIFAHRLDLNYKNTVNIFCKENKEICYHRRLKRDELERGRKRKEVKKKFINSWNLYFKNSTNYLNRNKIYELNTDDKLTYEKLIIKLKELYKKNQG